MEANLVNKIIKILFINLTIPLVDFKIINKKINFAIILQIIAVGIITTAIYIMLQKYFDNMLIIIILYCIQIAFLKMHTNKDKIPLFATNMISNALVYANFGISLLIEILFIVLFKIYNETVNFLIVSIIEMILLMIFFKIRRFSKGFKFLQNKSNNDYLDIVMFNISSVEILAYYLIGNYYGHFTKQMAICFIIIVIIMILLIQKTLSLYYKQGLIGKNIEDYKSQIFDKDKQIEKLSKEKYKISKLNHEFYNRQKALELKVKEFVNNVNVEMGEELSVIESINKLSSEYSEKLEQIKNPDKLPSTDIEEIDDMFKYMQSECSKNGIIFNLQVTDNIHYMINNIIEQDKLVTLIGDHIRDAIIAVSNSENKFKSIIAILGKKDNCYEFCVYDTGIEFEIDTLLKLGIEPATTHKDTGGTGIGFMTTFETMKETKASLIISENKPADDDYTKSVAIRFDNKNEYRICSYRANQMKEKDTNNRIIIENKSIAK